MFCPIGHFAAPDLRTVPAAETRERAVLQIEIDKSILMVYHKQKMTEHIQAHFLPSGDGNAPEVLRMEQLTSRKNQYIQHLRKLASDSGYRREQGEYVLDGLKLLEEALDCGAVVTGVLWSGQAAFAVPGAAQYTAPRDLVEYASPLKNAPGPVFTVRLPEQNVPERLDRVLVLENVQDPGNVGTVVRTANAMGMDAVVLVGACASVFSAKTARAAMGALFRQCVLELDLEELAALLADKELPLYGAALSHRAQDARQVDLSRCAVAIGSEGRGLSEALLARCRGEVIIPMEPCSESLNAGVAAAILMWEMRR